MRCAIVSCISGWFSGPHGRILIPISYFLSVFVWCVGDRHPDNGSTKSQRASDGKAGRIHGGTGSSKEETLFVRACWRIKGEESVCSAGIDSASAERVPDSGAATAI